MQKKPEIELLLSCARRCPSAKTADRIRSVLAQSINWDFLLEKATSHGMTALLWHHFAALGISNAIPARVCLTLKHNLYANIARNTIFGREMINVVRALGAAGIEALPHKGPVLARLAYEDYWLRNYCDLDILIRKSDYPAAGKVLENLDYEALAPSGDLQEFGLNSTNQVGFYNRKTGIIVDLQWALMPAWRADALDFDRCWERAVPLAINGGDIRTLGREDMIFVLAIHGSKHLWSRIEWIASFVSFFEAYGPQIHLEELVRRGRVEGQLAMLLLGFWLARELLGTETRMPLEEERRIREVGEIICGHLLEGSEDEMLNPVKRFSLVSRLSLGGRTSVRQWAQVVMQPTLADWEWVKLPAWLCPLYYAIRPLRLLCRYLMTAHNASKPPQTKTK